LCVLIGGGLFSLLGECFLGTPVRWTDNPGRRFCYPQCFWRLGEASTAETVKPLRASGRAGDLQNNNLTMGTSTMRKLLTPVMGIFTMLGVLVTPAEAATVSLIPGATQSSVGATVTLSIEGSGFTGNADGGGFSRHLGCHYPAARQRQYRQPALGSVICY